MEELKTIYNQSFGYWSDKNYENGDVARWIKNAEACTHVRVKDALQDWPKQILERAIQGIEFDNGPHSVTRVQFRMRLMADAMGQNDQKRTDAIARLKFMKEKGVLMALRNEQGPLGDMAASGFLRGHESENLRTKKFRMHRAARRRKRAAATSFRRALIAIRNACKIHV